MAWSQYHYILAFVMVVTGSINTLSATWADQTKAIGIDGNNHLFSHPFLQACGMFLGEMLCFIGFFVARCYLRTRTPSNSDSDSNVNTKFNPFIFLPPALCDMMGTSIMYLGLTFTSASSFQMLRGAVIIFTGLLSVAFLGRVLKWFQWVGMGFVILGLFIVGLSDFVSQSSDNHDTNGVITGDLLIVMAQIIVAVQMVIEEKFVVKNNVPPLLAVGCEGLFGFTILSILLIPMYFIKLSGKFALRNPDGRLEDALDGFQQLRNSWQISLATFGNILSIAFFNFAGISVTKEMSATTRMVLDSVRTIVIWVVSLALKWQTFYYLQIVGFIFLILGMCFYYDIIVMPTIRSRFHICLEVPNDDGMTTRIVENEEDSEPVS